MNIVVFASHNGSDLQAIIDGCESNKIGGKVVAVISNNSDSFALKRAKAHNIPNYHMSLKTEGSEENLATSILSVLEDYDADIVFLAGYLKKLDNAILEKYHNRIFNVHPALLPKYGGRGMFGENIHKAVVAAKEKETGVTVHRVSSEYDNGEIVAQIKVPVHENDTYEDVGRRVLDTEHIFLVEVLNDITTGKIKLGE